MIAKLPEIILTQLGFAVGKKVSLSIRDHELLIRPIENVTSKITDSLKLDNVKLIEDIIETEDWEITALRGTVSRTERIVEAY